MFIKKPLITLLAIMLVIIVLLFYKQDNKIIVSKAPTIKSSNKNGAKLDKIKNRNKIYSNEILNKIKASDRRIRPKSRKLTYLKLYKMYRLAVDCQPLYKRKTFSDNSEDLFEMFADYLQQISKNRQQLVTSSQTETFETFINNCKDLKEQTKDFKKIVDQFNRSYLSQSIKSKMLKTDAITNEEKELKNIIRLIKEIKVKSRNIHEISIGNYAISGNEIDQVWQSIIEIKSKLFQLSHENINYSQTEEYKLLLATLHDEETYLKSLNTVNTKQINSFFQKQTKQVALLINHLQTNYSTVFYEAHNQIMELDWYYGSLANNENSPINQKPPLIKSIIAKQLNIKDTLYYDSIYPFAIDLYTCYLGADCSANSSIIRNYCFGGFYSLELVSNNIYQEACNLTVAEFYLQHFLSPNQLEDTNQVFEYLINNYAN